MGGGVRVVFAVTGCRGPTRGLADGAAGQQSIDPARGGAVAIWTVTAEGRGERLARFERDVDRPALSRFIPGRWRRWSTTAIDTSVRYVNANALSLADVNGDNTRMCWWPTDRISYLRLRPTARGDRLAGFDITASIDPRSRPGSMCSHPDRR